MVGARRSTQPNHDRGAKAKFWQQFAPNQIEPSGIQSVQSVEEICCSLGKITGLGKHFNCLISIRSHRTGACKQSNALISFHWFCIRGPTGTSIQDHIEGMPEMLFHMAHRGRVHATKAIDTWGRHWSTTQLNQTDGNSVIRNAIPFGQNKGQRTRP